MKLTGPKTSLSLDLRGLAAFRVALALLMLWDTVNRAVDLRAHYTDFGILPTGPYVEEFANRFHISLHLANGTLGWQAFLFTLAFLAGAALLVGWRTKLATVAAWVLVVSVQNRNPMILNGGDVLYRCLLFWAMFLPLGARWSVDRALATNELPEEPRYLGGPSVALTLQVAFVYLTTAALKSGKEWWPDGTASWYALSLDMFTTPFGKFLLNFPQLLTPSTWLVWWFEVLAGFLLFTPVFFVPVRTLVLCGLAFMHFNFDLTMRLGYFPWVDMAALVPLLPREVWDWLGRRMKTPERLDLRIYYDGDCGFCKKVVYVMRGLLLVPETRVAPAQDDPEMAKVLAQEASWIVVDAKGERHLRWDGIVTVLEHVPFFGSLIGLLPLRALAFVGDPLYRFVAGHRAAFGLVTKRLLPWHEMPEPRTNAVLDLVTLLGIAYVGLWNVKTVPEAHIDIVEPWNRIASVLRLDQKWNMFAPYPLKEDGWYVVDGTLKDGSKVDLLSGKEEPASYDKPDLVSAQFTNSRWRKYMMNIYSKSKKGHRLYYGKYLCRSWNEVHEEDGRKLARFELVFMKERTELPGVPMEVKRVSLWNHDCFKKKTADAGSDDNPEG